MARYALISRAAVQVAYTAIGAILLSNPQSMTEIAHYQILLSFHGPWLWGVLFLFTAFYVLVEMVRGRSFRFSSLALAALLSATWAIGITSASMLGVAVMWSTPIAWGLVTALIVASASHPMYPQE